MNSIVKALKKATMFLMNTTKVHYAIGSVGMLRFIFNPKIDMSAVEQLIALTHYNEKLRKALVDSVLSNNAQKHIVDQRMSIHPDLELFSTYPKEALGYKYYDFILKNNLVLLSYPDRYLRKCDPYTYIFLRMLNSHDIYHVLLGADVSLHGEGFVASFTIEQLPYYPPPCVHIGIGFIRYAMEHGHSYDKALKVIGNGSIIGQRANDLFCVNWDDYWHTDISIVRKELNITVFSRAISKAFV
jgi:ubiquinone biosynthesis protein COQ4